MSILTKCSLISILLVFVSCNSMQNVRNGEFKFYNKENNRKIKPKNEILTKSNETNKKVEPNLPNQDTNSKTEKVIAGKVIEIKPPTGNDEIDFMKMKLEKLEEEIRILKNEIIFLTNLLSEKRETNNYLKEESKIKSQNTEKSSKSVKKGKNLSPEKTKKHNDKIHNNIQDLAQTTPREAQNTIEQNKRVEEVILLIKERKYDLALKKIDSYLKEENDLTNISQLYYWKGEALFYTKDYLNAVECFQRVLSFPKAKKRIESQIMIAECYTKLGRMKEAKREYQRFIEEYPFSEYTSRAKRMIQQL